MTPNLDAWLSRLEEIERVATAEPWGLFGKANQHVRTEVGMSEFRRIDVNNQSDAELIVESRNSFKQLLKIVRIQREALVFIENKINTIMHLSKEMEEGNPIPQDTVLTVYVRDAIKEFKALAQAEELIK